MLNVEPYFYKDSKMKIKHLFGMALTLIMVIGMAAAAWANTTQDTYVGKLEYQDQTITKKTAALLHRHILLQRATQLVGWAMPMMNFYQLYPALNSNRKVSGDVDTGVRVRCSSRWRAGVSGRP